RCEPEISNLPDRPKTSSPPPTPPHPQYRRGTRCETRQTQLVSRPACEKIVQQCAAPLRFQSSRHRNKTHATKFSGENIQQFPAPVRLRSGSLSPETTNARSVPIARELPDGSADDCAREYLSRSTSSRRCIRGRGCRVKSRRALRQSRLVHAPARTIPAC